MQCKTQFKNEVQKVHKNDMHKYHVNAWYFPWKCIVYAMQMPVEHQW